MSTLLERDEIQSGILRPRPAAVRHNAGRRNTASCRDCARFAGLPISTNERFRQVWLALWISVSIGMLPGATFAQVAASPSDATGAKSEAEPLWEAVVDPTAVLAQVRFLDFYSPGNFQTSAQTNIFLLQPIIPVAPLSLLPAEQLIRFTFKVSTLATGPSSHPITALGDTQMYDLFQGKWSQIERWKLRLAIGAIGVFPTATDRRAGASAWQAGPAAGISFAGVPDFWAGLLVQNPISFAYTRPGRHPKMSCFFNRASRTAWDRDGT